MDFSSPPEVQELVARVREFVRREVLPLERRVGGGFKALEPALRELRASARRQGLWAPQLSRELGGMGLDLMAHAQVSEELGRSPLGHYALNCQAPDAGNMEILHAFGTDEQKAQWLAPLVAGEIRSCFSMTEVDRPGSNPTWLDTRAVRDGDSWVIDGHKWFTSSADGARFAIVMAVTDPDAPPHLRASQIIVPTDAPGFRLVRNIPVMGEAGEGWMSHAEIRYEGVRVPLGNLLGGQSAGFAIAQERLGPGRIHHCMRWIGICERSFELLCQRAATRELSKGKPLGTKQIVQEWIADSRAAIDAARLMVLHAAWKMEREGAHAARVEISSIKYYVAEVMLAVVDRAVQAHGALGMTDDTPLAFFYRHERAARIYDGADEVHKAVVARRVLKQYGLELK
jgi:alkylation response protein AidB-like acyl-CoA dehydrogenase